MRIGTEKDSKEIAVMWEDSRNMITDTKQVKSLAIKFSNLYSPVKLANTSCIRKPAVKKYDAWVKSFKGKSVFLVRVFNNKIRSKFLFIHEEEGDDCLADALKFVRQSEETFPELKHSNYIKWGVCYLN